MLRGNVPYLLREDVDPFDQYFREEEPGRREKAYAWETGIGLQAVDQLKTSKYLLEVAQKNIEGEISMEDAKRLLAEYHQENRDHLPERTEEADIVTARISEILAEKAFSFSPAQYLSIHRRLFQGILPDAGEMRSYNISKEEWILNGQSILYGSATELKATLDYDFQMEREFNYAGLSIDEKIHHLARFVSGLWQIHVFGEGNTRTTAVFFIKYLRYLGFDATNDLFAKNAWCFRNALVRANYTNMSKNLRNDTRYLELFVRNLLLGEHHELRNRELHIDWPQKKTAFLASKQPFKQPFETENSLLEKLTAASVSDRTSRNILKAREKFGTNRVFGRREIMDLLHLTERPATTLLRRMLDLGITERVSGAGKGRYHFLR